MYIRYFFSVLVLLFTWSLLEAQDGPMNSKEEMDKQYEENITKSRINAVYIPKDIDDAYEEFLHLSPEESLDQFKNADEGSVSKKLHFGIGRWMIVNWNFYDGSRLSQYLRELGLLHPDDMADFLIVIFHRKLNENELNVEELVSSFATLRAEKMKNMGSIHFDKDK